MSSSVASQFLAGFGRADITPPVGVDLTGFIARENPSREVLHPLHARAAMLALGDERVLIVGLECLALDPALCSHLRDRLSAAIGIPTAHIALWCTHTHSGPATVKLYGCGTPDDDYLQGRFTRGAVEAAEQAVADLSPARGEWSTADGAPWHQYRRTGSDSRRRAESVDHAIRTLWFAGKNGEALGCLWFYAAHPTLLGEAAISGDYVGVASRSLEEASGGVALLGAGCCGDVAPRAGGAPREAVEFIGRAVSQAALEGRPGAAAVEFTRLECRTAACTVPLLPPMSPKRYEEYAEESANLAAGQPPGVARRSLHAMAEWGRRWARDVPPTVLVTEIQVIRLGPVLMVSLPFEPFSAIGSEIRRRVPGDVVVVGYANGCCGYLPPAAEYGHGGYEIEEAYRYYSLPSMLAPEAAERVVDQACRLCR